MCVCVSFLFLLFLFHLVYSACAFTIMYIDGKKKCVGAYNQAGFVRIAFGCEWESNRILLMEYVLFNVLFSASFTASLK